MRTFHGILSRTIVAGVLVVASFGAGPAKYEPPDGSTYHGVCLTGYWNKDEFARSLDRFRKDVTAVPPLVVQSWFAHCQEHGKWRTWHWMNKTPDGGTCCGPARDYAETSRHNGLVPVIAWTWMNYGDEKNSPRLQDLTAGKYDWYLDDWIKGVTEFKDPMFIRLSHEMDGNWYPYSEGYKADPRRNTTADYVAYWRYVVDRFRKAGVQNVAWVWCVNGDHSGGGRDWQLYYPGDDYTDWLAIDLYSARNPKEVVGKFLDLYGKTGKPIMIPEGGAGPEATKYNRHFTTDAAWVAELFDTIESTPRIKALCWFEYGKQWELERDPGQLAEYQRRIKAARYGAAFDARMDEKR
jgi:hypothetical protein